MFLPSSSEQIHACCGLSTSKVRQGQDAQESHKNLVEWIHEIVTSSENYDHSINGVLPAAAPTTTPANIRRLQYPYHPLVHQKLSKATQTSIIAKLSEGDWGADCSDNEF